MKITGNAQRTEQKLNVPEDDCEGLGRASGSS